MSSLRLAQFYGGGRFVYIFDLFALSIDLLKPLWSRPLIAHNAIFDLKQLLWAGAVPRKLGCTLLMDNALSGRRTSLATLAREYLDWEIPKELQRSNWRAPRLTYDQLAYAALDAVAVEEDGLVRMEAEDFYKQTEDGVRRWQPFPAARQAEMPPDPDPAHTEGASGGAYLEILPDTRATHDDELKPGENFSNEPGKLGVLHYQVDFTRTGRYYVWVRAYSTGTEDNGIHVGLDGEWPESGQRMQWCEGKNSWRWESKQRTEEVHCGEPYKIYLDVEEAGRHEITFSMREDGFEFDCFLLTLDREFVPGDL